MEPRRAALGLVAAAILVPVLPNLPFASAPTQVPTYFSTPAARNLHQGSVVLTYPYPIYPDNQAMLWQAQASMKFRLIGGYEVTPDASGNGTLYPTGLRPPQMEQLFGAAMYGPSAARYTLPPRTPQTFTALRQFLRTYAVATIVVSPTGERPLLVVGYLRRLLGVPVRSDGAFVWQHVQLILDRRSSVTTNGTP